MNGISLKMTQILMYRIQFKIFGMIRKINRIKMNLFLHKNNKNI
jgi:hypothetical protein